MEKLRFEKRRKKVQVALICINYEADEFAAVEIMQLEHQLKFYGFLLFSENPGETFRAADKRKLRKKFYFLCTPCSITINSIFP